MAARQPTGLTLDGPSAVTITLASGSELVGITLDIDGTAGVIMDNDGKTKIRLDNPGLHGITMDGD